MKPGRTSVCVELCASIHPKMGKLSRSSGRGGAYLVGRPSSAGGGRGGGEVEGVEGFVVTFVWPGTTSLPLG